MAYIPPPQEWLNKIIEWLSNPVNLLIFVLAVIFIILIIVLAKGRS